MPTRTSSLHRGPRDLFRSRTATTWIQRRKFSLSTTAIYFEKTGGGAAVAAGSGPKTVVPSVVYDKAGGAAGFALGSGGRTLALQRDTDGSGQPTGAGVRIMSGLPSIYAGVDGYAALGQSLILTAVELPNDYATTDRSWSVVSGPAEVANTLSTTVDLNWMPLTDGTYVLRFSAINAQGSSTSDISIQTVGSPSNSSTALGDFRNRGR